MSHCCNNKAKDSSLQTHNGCGDALKEKGTLQRGLNRKRKLLSDHFDGLKPVNPRAVFFNLLQLACPFEQNNHCTGVLRESGGRQKANQTVAVLTCLRG